VLYRARRDQAAAELEKSRASLAYQQVNFNRVKSLHDQGTGSDIEFADAKRAYDEAQAQVQADTAALAWAEKALIDTQVLAPISGVVLERNVEVGDFVAAEGGRGANANAQFASIADMTKLRVEIDISELDIGRVHAGQPCIITPDAYKDRRYDGRVMWIDPGANYAKATVQVKVRIEQPDDFLRVEGSAKVEFLADKPAAVASDDASPRIWIPAVACQVQPDSRTARVFIIDDGRLRETTIQIGRQTGGQVEVVSGLSEGQSIASDGLDKLRDGQRVKS
jgi:HlyD family secretion protein